MATRRAQKTAYNTIVICLLAGGLAYVCSRFIHPGVEYTDNAQVKQHITPVNTRVQGFIKKICFEEYQPVRKGDTLLIIEDAEFRLRLAQAEADLAKALAGQKATSASIATTQNNLSVSDAGISEVRVQMDNARRELERYRSLLTPVLRRILDTHLRLWGHTAPFAVEWQDISLQDTAELAQARYDNARAAVLEEQLTEKGEIV